MTHRLSDTLYSHFLEYKNFLAAGLVTVGLIYCVDKYVQIHERRKPSEMAGGPFKKIFGSSNRKPATAPDGRTDKEAGGDEDEKTGVFHDLLHLGIKDYETLGQALTTLASGEPIDDKELLLEHGVAMLQTLPPNRGLGEKVANQFIEMLYNDLPHPPGTIAGPTARYRRNDGGGNNPWDPELGKAGSPYSRSVPPLKPKGPNLPDPELVFEQLLKRKGEFRKHPSGLNRLFFSFATIVIHECFQTNRTQHHINDTSSYVDLSTLYGNTEKEQKPVRTKVNGKIFPDTIASDRIMMMPPGVVAILMLFSRNHNTIAENLLSINEQGMYEPWDSLKPEQQAKQDEDIFQLARNINVGFFATVVLKDYVAAILNTPRADSTWWLNLGDEIKAGNKRVERGVGNVVSVEFCVLYHWHAALSDADAKWMEYILREAIPGLKSLDDVTPEKFQMVLKGAAKMLSGPPNQWVFNNLKRGKDGSFDNADLAKIIKDCVEEPAHAFGPRGTPAALKVVDIMGQLQARNVFNVCTMNEFRKYLNLKEYDTFYDWCEDAETAKAAELLYGHIDNLELYPGLMAECTKPAIEGSGVCPGQTTGRGILDDAVALVRGDRFLSYDLNSNTLTNWGVGKIGTFPQGSYGGMIPHLIFNGLPDSFPGTSSYALLPFYTPEAVQGILKGNKAIEKYDIERPGEETVVGIHTQAGCKKAFEDRDTFRVMYNSSIVNATNGQEFFMGWDEQKKHDDRARLLEKILFEDNFEKNARKFFSDTIQQLIKKSSLKYPNEKYSVDIVRDVINVAPFLWLASRFAIPIKSVQQPQGLLSVAELFDLYVPLYLYLNFNIIPMNEWALRDAAEAGSKTLLEVFEAHLKSQKGWKEGITDWMAKGSAFEVGPDADRIYHAFNDSKMSVSDSATNILCISAEAAGKLTHQASLLVDLFFSEGYEQYKARIIELANKDDEGSFKELEGFVLEGMRHAAAIPGVPRVASKSTSIKDGARDTLHIRAGQRVLIATSKAAMDPAAFPEPEKLNPHRSTSSYIVLGDGIHQCFGSRMVTPILATVLKEVFKLKHVCRSPGRAGHLSKLEHEFAGVKIRQYLDPMSKEFPVPTTMSLMYGDDNNENQKETKGW